MSQSPILIRNIYVMLAYAFRSINSELAQKVSSEEFEHLHDLLAEILIQGVNSQVKRGLYRDYLARSEELPSVRGQIDFGQTLSQSSRTHGRVVCSFDEYLPDVPHNQVLKSVITLLIKKGEVGKLRAKALRRLLPYLEEVTSISPSTIRWRDLQFHRANASYRLLLGVCELIVHGLLPTESEGESKLNSWFAEEAMSTLFERFLREYFAFHHPELSPAAPHVKWDFDDAFATGVDQLPAMKTDLTLRTTSHTLIIDAKYYGKSLQTSGFGGKGTVHSGNLYQILTYVKNQDVEQSGSASGLLLYAQTAAEVQPDLDIIIQGNRIGAQALNLNAEWNYLNQQLEKLTEWLAE